MNLTSQKTDKVTIIEKQDDDQKKYDEVHKMIEETKLRCQNTLSSCNKTLLTISDSMQALSDARSGIDSFYSEFDKALKGLCGNIASAFLPKNHAFKNTIENCNFEDSKVSTIGECVQLCKNKKKIVFLTGAGISHASGVPTFRGEGAAPLFSKDGVTYKNEEIATYSFMKDHPDLFWERNLQFVEGMNGKKHNISHLRIQELMNYFKEQSSIKKDENGSKVVLITQNIDGLDCDAYNKLNPKNTDYLKEGNESFGFCPHVYEVHGSKDYLRCDNQECSQYDIRFRHPLKYNSYKDLICQKCKTQARPSILYFNEQYDEKNYRIQSARDDIKDMDLLICIGTQLETGFAAATVDQAVKQNVPIIEISLTPVIEKGGFTLKGKAEQLVPALCEQLMGINKQIISNSQQSNIKNKVLTKSNVNQKVTTQRKSITSNTTSTSTSTSLSNSVSYKTSNIKTTSIKQTATNIKPSSQTAVKTASVTSTVKSNLQTKPKNVLPTKK